MRGADLLHDVAWLDQPLDAVLAQRLEHPEPRHLVSASSTRCSSDLSTSPESRSAVTTAVGTGHVRPRDRSARSPAVTPPGKTATPFGERPLGVGSSRSQLHATTARSVWCRGSAVRLPPVSSRNRSSSRSATCCDGQRPQPRGRQLDRQRQAVEPRGRSRTTASTVSASRAKSGRTACGPVDEQRGPTGTASASSTDRPAGGSAQRRHRAQRLAGDAERLPAGGQDPQPRRPARAARRPARRPRRPGARSCRGRAAARGRPAPRRAGRWRRPARPGRSARSGWSRAARASRAACCGSSSGSVTGASSASQTPSASDAGERARPPRWPAGSCPPRPARPA